MRSSPLTRSLARPLQYIFLRIVAACVYAERMLWGRLQFIKYLQKIHESLPIIRRPPPGPAGNLFLKTLDYFVILLFFPAAANAAALVSHRRFPRPRTF